MTTTPETFNQLFFFFVALTGRQVPSHNKAFHSVLLTDWQRADFNQPTLVQHTCWTERFIGPTKFNPSNDTRIRVMRLEMDFWYPLDDEESEEDVIGLTGQMHVDFDLYGSPEYWRDVFPEINGIEILEMDTGEGSTPPVFSAENLGGILMHYTIGVSLKCAP